MDSNEFFLGDKNYLKLLDIRVNNLNSIIIIKYIDITFNPKNSEWSSMWVNPNG